MTFDGNHSVFRIGGSLDWKSDTWFGKKISRVVQQLASNNEPAFQKFDSLVSFSALLNILPCARRSIINHDSEQRCLAGNQCARRILRWTDSLSLSTLSLSSPNHSLSLLSLSVWPN